MAWGSGLLRRLVWRIRYRRRTCLDCGFFAFDDGSEAGQGPRSTVLRSGSDGWFKEEGVFAETSG